ncbi:hypothetical protein [Mucilaginibacter psychrotolerans]|uniref:DoxX family protein n=1 Tax=Mucilaginibacter psychrotolerans TaxID=1524096 RepID=A0A4Y8S6K2_9SPHI|nr:hypothetical protein [Mucilaginibacter psychrotolerans]TFF34235.1 hypothetical protein E2R66_22890 [Mucilaginibacter psychrotolerans]
MKILTPAMHGVADYLIVIFLWSAPTLFVLPGDLSRIAYGMGIAHLVLTICTDNTAGIFRFFSMRVHGIIEVALGVLLIVLCYTLLQYDDRAKPFLMTYGVLLLVLSLVTDYSYIKPDFRKLRASARLRDPNTAL